MSENRAVTMDRIGRTTMFLVIEEALKRRKERFDPTKTTGMYVAVQSAYTLETNPPDKDRRTPRSADVPEGHGLSLNFRSVGSFPITLEQLARHYPEGKFVVVFLDKWLDGQERQFGVPGLNVRLIVDSLGIMKLARGPGARPSHCAELERKLAPYLQVKGWNKPRSVLRVVTDVIDVARPRIRTRQLPDYLDLDSDDDQESSASSGGSIEPDESAGSSIEIDPQPEVQAPKRQRPKLQTLPEAKSEDDGFQVVESKKKKKQEKETSPVEVEEGAAKATSQSVTNGELSAKEVELIDGVSKGLESHVQKCNQSASTSQELTSVIHATEKLSLSASKKGKGRKK